MHLIDAGFGAELASCKAAQARNDCMMYQGTCKKPLMNAF